MIITLSWLTIKYYGAIKSEIFVCQQLKVDDRGFITKFRVKKMIRDFTRILRVSGSQLKYVGVNREQSPCLD